MSRFGNVNRSGDATNGEIVFSCSGKEGCAWAQIHRYNTLHPDQQIEGTLEGECLASAFGPNRLVRPCKRNCQGKVFDSRSQQR